MDTMLITDQPKNGKPGFFFYPGDMADITIRKNTKAPVTFVKKNKRAFPIVCTCGSNTSLKFQIKILKIERGIAEMPFSPFLVETLDLHMESSFGHIS